MVFVSGMCVFGNLICLVDLIVVSVCGLVCGLVSLIFL